MQEKFNMLVTFQGYGAFEIALPTYGNLRLEQNKVYYITNAPVNVLEFLRSMYQFFVRVNVNPIHVDKADLIIDYDKLTRKTTTPTVEKIETLKEEIVETVDEPGQPSEEVEEVHDTADVNEESGLPEDPAKYKWTKGKNKGKTIAQLDKAGKLSAVLRTATDEEKAIIEAYRKSKGE